MVSFINVTNTNKMVNIYAPVKSDLVSAQR